MVSKQPVMISFDSSIDGGMDAVLNAAADMYLSKGDNGECGGMLPLEDAVALLSDPSDIIDFVSSPEYSAESVVESPVSDRGGETTGEDASEPGGDIESLDDDDDFALSRALEISLSLQPRIALSAKRSTWQVHPIDPKTDLSPRARPFLPRRALGESFPRYLLRSKSFLS